MLTYMGWTETADKILEGIKKTIASGNVIRNFYLLMKKEGLKGNLLSTSEFTKKLIEAP